MLAQREAQRAQARECLELVLSCKMEAQREQPSPRVSPQRASLGVEQNLPHSPPCEHAEHALESCP